MLINMIPDRYYEGTKALEGNIYKFTFWWNNISQTWTMNVKGISDPTIEMNGLTVLPGIDIFAPYGYNKRLGELWLIDNSGANENPNFDDIGVRWQLNYIPLAEL